MPTTASFDVSDNFGVLRAPKIGAYVVARAKAESTKLLMDPKDDKARAYMLVEIHPGKEKEFGDEILSKGLLVNSKVERMDFVHGPYDFVLILSGTMEDIDTRLMDMRKSPYVRRTETLICFEMFDLQDISDRLKEQI